MTATAAAIAGARRRSAASASQARPRATASSAAAQDWRRAPPFAFHRYATPEQANAHMAQLIMRTRDLANLYANAEHGEPYPMTREAMDELRSLAWPVPGAPSDDECAICMAKYKAKDEVVQLPCEGKHVFHKRCLMQWFERQPVCPTCRFDCRGGLHGGRGKFSATGLGGGTSSSGAGSGVCGNLPAPCEPSINLKVSTAAGRTKAPYPTPRPPRSSRRSGAPCPLTHPPLSPVRRVADLRQPRARAAHERVAGHARGRRRPRRHLPARGAPPGAPARLLPF